MPNTAANSIQALAAAPLQVAVGIVKDNQGRVLVALRAKHVHQGGLWEFPGGKVEPKENVAQALTRELYEELGIKVLSSEPLITIRHQYPDLCVQLNVRSIQEFTGEAKGCEGQEIQWVTPDNLPALKFPAANVPIVTAARLPKHYAILDDSVLAVNARQKTTVIAQLLDYVNHLLAKNIKLIQIRLKQLPEDLLTEFLALVQIPCQTHGATLLLNSALPISTKANYGLHLTAADLMCAKTRPNCAGWVAASCHNWHQLQHAANIGIDFVVLAPVLPTLTHPLAQHLGWENFAALVEQVNIPVYALGGLQLDDLKQARTAGAQGLAGIRLFLA